MEKKEKKSKRMSSLWIIVIGMLLFYLPTLAVIFHYSKKGGLLYAVCFPLLIALPAILVIWRLSGAGSSSATHDSGDKTVTKTDSKDKSKDAATKTIVTETKKEKGSGKKWWTPIAKLFALLFTLFMISIVLFYITGNHRLKDMANGKGIGGILPTFWECLWKDNPDSAAIALKMQKENHQFVKDTMSIGLAERNSNRIKRTSLFGTVYKDDTQQTEKQADNSKEPTETQTDQTSSTKQGNYPQQQQYVEYPNAVPLGATTLTK